MKKNGIGKLLMTGLVLAGTARADLECSSKTGGQFQLETFSLGDAEPFLGFDHKAIAIMKSGNKNQLFQGTVHDMPTRVGSISYFSFTDDEGQKATLEVKNFIFANPNN